MIWLFVACAATEADIPTEVVWAGYVYKGDSKNSDDRLGEGSVSATLGETLVEAEQPYADYPGFWQFAVAPGEPVNVRIEGADVLSSVWAGETPTKDGNWLGGSLFAATPAYVEALFETLGEDGDAWVITANNVDVLVIGVPSDPEWTCADVALSIGDTGYSPACWAVSDDGAYFPATTTDSAIVFAALVPAGMLTVRFKSATETYATVGGDVVLAYFLVDAPS